MLLSGVSVALASSGGPPAHAATRLKPFKIAVIGGETGLYAFVGKYQHQGATLAIKDLNAAGGVNGATITASYTDDGGDPTRGINAATQAVSNGDSAIIGSPDTGVAIAPLGPRLKLPMVGEITGGGPIIYPNGLSQPPNPWAFELSLDITVEAAKVADIAASQGCTKIALLHDTTDFGKAAAAAAVGRERQSHTTTPVINDGVPEDWTKSSSPNVAPELAKLKGAKVNCVITFVSGPAVARLVQQAAQEGYKPKIIGGNQLTATPEFVKLGGSAANGALSLDYASSYHSTALGRKVAAEYKASGGQLVNGEAPNFVYVGYDSVLAVAAAVKQANSTSPQAIRNALEHLKNVQGTLGTFGFTPREHRGYQPNIYIAIQLKNGAWRPLS